MEKGKAVLVRGISSKHHTEQKASEPTLRLLPAHLHPPPRLQLAQGTSGNSPINWWVLGGQGHYLP